MSIKRRLERLERRTGAAVEEITGLYVVAYGEPEEPEPGAVLLAKDGAVSTWRLPDGRVQKVVEI